MGELWQNFTVLTSQIEYAELPEHFNINYRIKAEFLKKQKSKNQKICTLQNFLYVLQVAWKPPADAARTIQEPKSVFYRSRPTAKKNPTWEA